MNASLKNRLVQAGTAAAVVASVAGAGLVFQSAVDATARVKSNVCAAANAGRPIPQGRDTAFNRDEFVTCGARSIRVKNFDELTRSS